MTFLGLVRNHNLGRSVRYLEYEAYEPLALKAFERIARGNRATLAGRAAGAAPSDRPARDRRGQRRDRGARRRTAATRYAACRYAIERVKQIAPIWKREFFEGGDVWIEGATADPDDERRGPRRSGSRARDRPAVRAAARHRRRSGAGARCRGRARRSATSGAQLAGEFPELAALRAIDLDRGQRRLRADGSTKCATATKSRSCRRCRGDDDDETAAALSTQRKRFSASLCESPRST